MTDVPPVGETPSSPAPTASTPNAYSSGEKLIGAIAGYEMPLVSSIVATSMLQTETDPERRRQLLAFRRATLIWLGVGLALGLVALVVGLTLISNNGSLGGCRGGADMFDPLNTTYQSTDNVHWTVTYPCVNGGHTTAPIDANQVPGLQPTN